MEENLFTRIEKHKNLLKKLINKYNPFKIIKNKDDSVKIAIDYCESDLEDIVWDLFEHEFEKAKESKLDEEKVNPYIASVSDYFAKAPSSLVEETQERIRYLERYISDNLDHRSNRWKFCRYPMIAGFLAVGFTYNILIGAAVFSATVFYAFGRFASKEKELRDDVLETADKRDYSKERLKRIFDENKDFYKDGLEKYLKF